MEKSHAVGSLLPVEIIQSILLQLDVESYHAARSTCQSWRHAASAPCMLSHILQQTPMLMPPETSSLTAAEWNRYFAQISRLNLLSYRTNVPKRVYKLTSPSGYMKNKAQASSYNGPVTVTLEGSQLRVYSSTQAPWEFPVAPSLYPPWESVRENSMNAANSAYTPIHERYTRYCLAVSSRGDILAVALGKKIQIYSLRNGDAETRASPVEYSLNQTNKMFRFIPPARFEDTDGVIKSLEFTDDDSLLRVCIVHETTTQRPSRVRYLGNPDLARGWSASLSYWQTSLNHIYLDSVIIALDLASHGAGRCFLRGLRLLPSSFQIHSQHRHHHCTTRKMSRLEIADTTSTRYFIAALQTSLVDGYAVGSITPKEHTTADVQIHRVLPSRYYLPSLLRQSGSSNSNNDINDNILTSADPFADHLHPQVYQSNNNTPASTTPSTPTPVLSFPYQITSNPPRPTPPTSTTINTSTNTGSATDKTPSKLRLTLQRWSRTNLPSATFTFPLLATSPDNRLAVIYEPGGAHTRGVSRGGTLYVVNISSCTSAYQPYAGRRTAAGIPTNSTAAWLGVEKEEGPQDIIPAWPFLLDQLYLDVDSVGVEVVYCHISSSAAAAAAASSPASSSPSSVTASFSVPPSPSSSSSSSPSSLPTSSTSPPHTRTKPLPKEPRYKIWAISEEKGLKLEWELGANISSDDPLLCAGAQAG